MTTVQTLQTVRRARAPAQGPFAPLGGRALNPTRLDTPAFLLAAPFSYATRVANNPRMDELSAEEREPSLEKALRQWLDLYQFMASEALVYTRDLVSTANLGVVLDHLPERDTVIFSNFTSDPPVREADVGKTFFESLGYTTVTPPYKFEGEAELKHLHDNVYAGGYGNRSDVRAYEWMEKRFDIQIVKLSETEEYLYHLDCTVFPLTPEDTLVCTGLFAADELRALERHTNVIPVSLEECYSGICNTVRISNTLLNASPIQDLRAGTDDYASEIVKNRRLEDIAAAAGFELSLFNLSEYLKGGVLLSSMVLHLNRHSYRIAHTRSGRSPSQGRRLDA